MNHKPFTAYDVHCHSGNRMHMLAPESFSKEEKIIWYAEQSKNREQYYRGVRRDP